jgi:hypothetical protein
MVTTRFRLQEGVKLARDIEERAWSRINNHSQFRGRAKNFEVEYRDHVLTLRGAVPSFYLKQVLQTAVGDLEGVRLVDNNVQVIPSDGLG